MLAILPPPTNTFCNLPAEKRERILAVAVEEFAANGYQKASLNNVVKRSGIAKGSLYQYFENKEGLFFHIFECFTDLVKAAANAALAQAAKDDFFVQLEAIVWAGIRFIDTHPDYFQIYLRVVFEQDVPRREELVSRVRLFPLEYMGPLCEAGQRAGAIRDDIDPAMAVFLVDAALERFLQAYAKPYLDSGLRLKEKNERQLRDAVVTMIDVLRAGLVPQG
ncbi:MAG: TetR/AcrR family transcriptional regulator [Desulfobulbaceae bacterium]|nr:TetR/AcrR family transcriptional regulator [Desulfobulbaceae bacterium]